MYYTNPKAPTLVATYDSTISSSTAITLNSGTTYIEVTAVDKGIFMAWDRTVASSDFDEFIPVGVSKTFIRPSGITIANFIQQAATGILVCIEK